MTRFIFTLGGVMSGLGKGITTASIGLLLQSRGYKVTAVKIDPYINVDAGTMRPAEHGEIFVTKDGGEIDQDIGNYERFLNLSLTKSHNITTGKVFSRVIQDERSFVYGGRDVEMFPDVINAIKKLIKKTGDGKDFTLVEIGGTTGDLENMPFLHAARELGREHPALYIMLTYLPFLKNTGELKTKPTQHAVARLREIGIMPDFIITRNEIPIDKPRRETITKRCFVDVGHIIDDPDVSDIYEVPLNLESQDLTDKILSKFNLKAKKRDLVQWKDLVLRYKTAQKTVRIAIVGKYFKHGASDHRDVYISVSEALKHAAILHGVKLKEVAVQSTDLEKDISGGPPALRGVDGIVVPQGWGSRGTEGKIRAIRYARENKIPYLGLCFGMQMAVVEYARNVLGLRNANSLEVDSKTPHPVIYIMPDQEEYLRKKQYGGTIRLGQWPCLIEPGTVLFESYKRFGYNKQHSNKKAMLIKERHRHRYEVNKRYIQKLKNHGLQIAGISPDRKLVEAVALPSETHPFFVGTQFHPEYQSRPLCPHPLFVGFINAALENQARD